jgi:hypothetical protein
VIEIKLAPLPFNEFNDRKEEFKLLGLSLTKEPFEDKRKLYMPRPIPKPPWEVVSMDFPLEYYGVFATFNVADLLPYFVVEEDF